MNGDGTGARRESGTTALERAVAGERAASLGRLGRAVERAMVRLRQTGLAGGGGN